MAERRTEDQIIDQLVYAVACAASHYGPRLNKDGIASVRAAMRKLRPWWCDATFTCDMLEDDAHIDFDKRILWPDNWRKLEFFKTLAWYTDDQDDDLFYVNVTGPQALRYEIVRFVEKYNRNPIYLVTNVNGFPKFIMPDWQKIFIPNSNPIFVKNGYVGTIQLGCGLDDLSICTDGLFPPEDRFVLSDYLC
jgi:hypothetical protein